MSVPIFISLSDWGDPDIGYSNPVQLDRVARRFPKLPIVVGHGCWPWVQGVLGIAFANQNLFVSPDMYLMRLPGTSDYVAAANGYLADRFLFGSSYPSCPVGHAVKCVDEPPFSLHVRERLMRDNARRLLGL